MTTTTLIPRRADDDPRTLVEMCRLLRGAYEPHLPLDRSFLRKAAEIVQKHTATDAIHEPTETTRWARGLSLLKELHHPVEARGAEHRSLSPFPE